MSIGTENTIPAILDVSYQGQQVIVEYNEGAVLKSAIGNLSTIYTSDGTNGGTPLALELTPGGANQVGITVWNPNANSGQGVFRTLNGPFTSVLIPWEKVISIDKL